MARGTIVWFAVCVLLSHAGVWGQGEQPLAGTMPLKHDGDIASDLVAAVDAFLLRQTEASVDGRARYWQRDFADAAAYVASVEPNRRRLARILGVRDERAGCQSFELVATLDRPALVARSAAFQVFTVRWPAAGTLYGEGLLLVPNSPVKANVIALPHAGQRPEMLVGLEPGVPPASQFARRLAESGCQVLVMDVLGRRKAPRNGRAVLTDREYVYRAAFELGRHVIGYELQKIFAAADCLASSPGEDALPLGVIGWGDGGMLALYGAALDGRIDAACVSGYFTSRQNLWREPIDRNVFGLLNEFGDAEIATLVAPRSLIIEASRGPEEKYESGKGGAPGELVSPDPATVRREVERARTLMGPLAPQWSLSLIEPEGPEVGFGSPQALTKFLKSLVPAAPLSDIGDSPEWVGPKPDATVRQQRQVQQMDDFNQRLLLESPYVRREFMKRLDTSSLEKFEASVEWYRDYFREEVIGAFDTALLPPNARTRKVYDETAWTGYEVELDVYPGVFAYGILCIPKGIRPGERRPVVVCQHGLEGRPQQLVQGDHRAYHDFAARLAERGFVTFAPQNLYLFGDRFRTLQRKANPLKKTLFSIIVPQHQQITNWLKSLPFVDGRRIGFYGLSYGGKSAMRIPPLVPDYCLSICSADFNDWVWKNASTRAPYSYVWTGEYEIFEFDLGSTFNYSEMAALIAPRPFMVERGHFDGVSSDERVAYEYAKVRHLYQAKLGIGDRTEIEWFVGPHAIHGQGTFRFLHRHLRWPEPSENP